jgi:hypothetical protein
MKVIKLSELSMTELQHHDAWRTIESTNEDSNVALTPAHKNEDGMISKSNGEVWCLCNVHFSDGTQLTATSLCRGDSDYGPLLWSFWNGQSFISLVVPPAPRFVLDVEGPNRFCKHFDKKINQIFPLRLEVVPSFEVQPTKRSIIITEKGIAT